jgi:hypothetical protein
LQPLFFGGAAQGAAPSVVPSPILPRVSEMLMVFNTGEHHPIFALVCCFVVIFSDDECVLMINSPQKMLLYNALQD